MAVAQSPGPTSRSGAVAVVVALTWLLVGPRVELVGVGGASLRLEDFVLLFLGIFALKNWKSVREHRLIRPGIGLVLVVALIAVGVATALGAVQPLPSLLYALRPVEYWVVYPALAIVLWRDRSRVVSYVQFCLALVTVLNTGVAALQYLGDVSIGFSKFSNQRGAGLTAGPYELGAISALLACYWFAHRRHVLVLCSLASVLMSQSRVSLIAVVIALLIIRFSVRRATEGGQGPPARIGRSNGPHPLSVVTCMVLVVGAVVAGPTLNATLVQPALARAQSTSLSSSWTSASSVVARTPHVQTSDEYALIAYDGIGESILNATASADASSAVRFFRWQLLLRETTADPVHVVFGLGPSFPGPSVDGALLRIFFETGLLGIVAWGLLVRKWLQGVPVWFAAAIVSLLVGSMFIDLLFALRPMVVVWMLFALAGGPRSKNETAMKSRSTAVLKGIGRASKNEVV